MKKLLFALLVSVLCLGVLPAQEEEGEGDSMFSPSVSIENELTFGGVKSGEDETKGNVLMSELENETKAKFGVGIAIAEGFSLEAYLSDAIKVADKTWMGAKFDENNLVVGLGGSYSPMDALAVSFDLGYIAQTKLYGGGGKYTMQGNGVKFGTGIEVNAEAVSLELGLGYEFEGMFAKVRKDKGESELDKHQEFKNTITLEAKMDFFNFIKEGLNSGLVLSNETTITQNNTIDVKANKDNNRVYESEREIENEFAIGLHFAPVEFMDFTFVTKVNSKSLRVRDNDPNSSDFGKYMIPYSDPNAPVPPGVEPAAPFASTAVGLGIGLEFTKGIFTFGLEYSPTLAVKESYQVNKDASVIKQDNKDLAQEIKLTFGIEL